MEDQGGPHLEVLGRVAVSSSGNEPILIARPQVAAALAMLWDEGRPVRREELAELLWGDWDFPDHWQGAVRGVVTKARRVMVDAGLPAELLRADAGMVTLDLPNAATTDLAVAEDLVARATRALEDGIPSRAEDRAQRALTVLSQPVAVVAEGEWTRRLHLRVDTFGRQAHLVLAGALLAQGRVVEAVAAAELAIEHDPLDESAYGLLIEAHLAAGRPAAARQVHGVLVETMKTELGVEPSGHLAELIDRPRGQVARIVPVVDRSRAEIFLGRQDELATMSGGLDESIAEGHPNLVLVTGPAGIGKTRLVEEFVSRVDATRLWGRCHLDTGEPFEPLAEAFRRYADSAEARGGVLDFHVSRAVKAFDTQDDVLVTVDGRAMRAKLLNEVLGAVRGLCSAGPTVLVVDDLHWASGDTLGLLGRILEQSDLPLLVVATARDEVSEPGSLSELLRAAPSTVLGLDTISAADLRPLSSELVALLDDPLDPDVLASQLWERTGGLPYFVSEIVRDARRRNRFVISSVPDQVRSWVRHRVDALPEDLVTLAEVAAVIGPSPAVSLIRSSWVGPEDRAVVGIEQLIRAGLLTETERSDEVAFAHQITRDVVEDRISRPRLAALHATVAERLAERPEDGISHARIAHHLSRSAPEHRRAAARHGYLAGVASLSRGAWDLADEQFDAALGRLDGANAGLRASILVAQGWTRHARGHAAEAVELLEDAGRVADVLHLPHEAARSVLLLVGRAGRGAAYGMADDECIARLRGALDALAHWPTPAVDHHTPAFPLDDASLAMLRTAVEVELAWAMLFTGSLAERTELLEGTLRRARADDAGPHRLARALLAQRNILTGPGQSDARLALAEEVLALPRRELPDEIVAYAELQLHEELLMRGDCAGARSALDGAEATIANHVHPYWKWAAATWESLWLLVDGSPEVAEAALGEAGTIQSDPSPEVAACSAVQLVSIRLAQGRADEVVDLLAAAAAAQPEIPCYAAVLALARSLAGDLIGAEATYRPFAQQAFANVPVDSNRLLTVAALGDVAATLGDTEGARVLDDLLAPDDGLFAVLNCYGGGGGWWGPVARIRSRLADVLGRGEDAVAARERATAMVNRSGAATSGQPWESTEASLGEPDR